MRKRGAIAILLALPAWVFVLHTLNKINSSPAGYEFGSSAYPVPLWFRAVSMFAVFLSVIGLCLLAFDFTQWIRRRLRDAN